MPVLSLHVSAVPFPSGSVRRSLCAVDVSEGTCPTRVHVRGHEGVPGPAHQQGQHRPREPPQQVQGGCMWFCCFFVAHVC